MKLMKSGSTQEGGITIMVTLALLVLLTIAAIGMSKNSLSEIRTSGFRRQGAMARNIADSGIEWSIYWISLDNYNTNDKNAQMLIKLKGSLAEDDELSGVARDIFKTKTEYYKPGSTEGDGISVNTPSPDYTQSFTIGLTRMGKMPIVGMSQGHGGYTPAAGGVALKAPDLWAIRSDARVKQGAVTFTHAKEAWVATPVK
jgi:hypothetical protein